MYANYKCHAERIVTETAKLDSLENEGNAKQLAMLRNLVGLNEVGLPLLSM